MRAVTGRSDAGTDCLQPAPVSAPDAGRNEGAAPMPIIDPTLALSSRQEAFRRRYHDKV